MLDGNSKSGKAVVIGAGVMGMGIAAHLTNVGWQVYILDRVSEGDSPRGRNQLAIDGLWKAIESRPPQFAVQEYAVRVRCGNIEDDLAWMADADWIVEAAAEDLEVKKAIFALISAHA